MEMSNHLGLGFEDFGHDALCARKAVGVELRS